ncbi:hypothetical protein [Salinisphaera sp. T31B1]|uniref:hypothetical protein n=1 Tax=Salinisphaera sp. T31B1 TaxID=727963 RepID=UPI00333FFEF0
MSGIKLKPVAQVEQEVSVPVPRGKGSFSNKKMLVTYRLRSATAMREFWETPADERPTDDELMRADIIAVKNVDRVVDVEGDLSTVETADLVDLLMDVPYIRGPLIQGWGDTQSNRDTHATKN